VISPLDREIVSPEIVLRPRGIKTRLLISEGRVTYIVTDTTITRIKYKTVGKSNFEQQFGSERGDIIFKDLAENSAYANYLEKVLDDELPFEGRDNR